MVRSRPSKTQLTNLHGSSITSSRLDSLMTKLSLPNLKLATNSVDFINFKPSQSKWVIPLWRRMPETQFLERGKEPTTFPQRYLRRRPLGDTVLRKIRVSRFKIVFPALVI